MFLSYFDESGDTGEVDVVWSAHTREALYALHTKREREDSAREESARKTRARRSESGNERTRRSGSCCFALISDCALPALLPGLFRRHRVFEEILVLRCEAFRKLENLKAVAIADGP